MKDCLGLAKEFQAKKPDNDNNDGARGCRPPGDNNNAFWDHDKVVATIFGGLAVPESRRDRKLTAQLAIAMSVPMNDATVTVATTTTTTIRTVAVIGRKGPKLVNITVAVVDEPHTKRNYDEQ